jgi:hypothetical protein
LRRSGTPGKRVDTASPHCSIGGGEAVHSRGMQSRNAMKMKKGLEEQSRPLQTPLVEAE